MKNIPTDMKIFMKHSETPEFNNFSMCNIKIGLITNV